MGRFCTLAFYLCSTLALLSVATPAQTGTQCFTGVSTPIRRNTSAIGIYFSNGWER